MRQLLTFDDFNYEPYNKNVLDLNMKVDAEGNSPSHSNKSDSVDSVSEKPENEFGTVITRAHESDDTPRNEGENMGLFSKQQKIFFKQAQNLDPFQNLLAIKKKEASSPNRKQMNAVKIDDSL